MVCGSTLTTSMNDSMALSGCSLSRKLSPRKYESGNARDSRNRCLMSMRAAIHPMAKNSAGMGSSHQSSKSMEDSTPTHKFAYMPRIDSAHRAREANRSHNLSYGEDERQSDR